MLLDKPRWKIGLLIIFLAGAAVACRRDPTPAPDPTPTFGRGLQAADTATPGNTPEPTSLPSPTQDVTGATAPPPTPAAETPTAPAPVTPTPTPSDRSAIPPSATSEPISSDRPPQPTPPPFERDLTPPQPTEDDENAAVEDDGPPDLDEEIRTTTVQIGREQILVSGTSTLDVEACIRTRLLADAEPLSWWPVDNCADAANGQWQMAVPLDEGVALDRDTPHTLEAWSEGNPTIFAPPFHLDLAGPPE